MTETNLYNMINEPTQENTPQESGEIEHATTLYAEPIFSIGNYHVTNALLTSTISVVIIIIMSVAIRISIKKVPGKFQAFFETILEGALALADQVTGSRKKTEKVFPLVMAIFFFVLINNWIGILPFGAIGLVEKGNDGLSFIPFLRSGTADINTTIGLALMAVLGSNIFGILTIGVWKTLNKYVNLKALGHMVTRVRKDPTILLVAPIMFFVGILELIGEAAKVASLSFRLFGNVFAGEVLLGSMAALLAYILPVPFLFLEVFVGLIQALIFSMLTLVYFTIASEDHDEEHHE